MELKDLFDHVLLNSGQFIMAQNKVEMNEDRFKLLVDQAVAIFSKYSPYTVRLSFEVQGSRSHKFTPANTGGRGIPNMLSEVVPVRMLGMGPSVLASFKMPIMSDPYLDVRSEYPWDYNEESGVVTVRYSGEYNTLAVYRHALIKKELDDGKFCWHLPNITLRDDSFMNLLQGMFLQGLGRSRRAFTLTDLPIVMDADTIASEGKEMITEAKLQMQQESKFYLAYGG